MVSEHTCPPVLFLIFNRPDLTARVFARIREVRPSRLFIAADGPRVNHPGDVADCLATRAVVAHVDWPCNVITHFREVNAGCRAAVSSAITWFFEQVDAGIILEDDCLPAPSFFPYCAELLERYRDHPQVMSISGDRFGTKSIRGASYAFSIYHHIWGWATWRRAWCHYDEMDTSSACASGTADLYKLFRNRKVVRYWSSVATRFAGGQIDTWDYPWLFSCWKMAGLSVVPCVNLVENIGFDSRATHTRQGDSPLAGPSRDTLLFPLVHPKRVQRCRTIESESEQLFLSKRRDDAREPEGAIETFKMQMLRAGRRLCDVVTLLLHALVVYMAYALARRYGLPGSGYYRYGRKLGWALFRRKDPRAYRVLVSPVSITRYFEFDFVRRVLNAGTKPLECLDVSSPFLFSFHAVDNHPLIKVDMINPDVIDINNTQSLLSYIRGGERIKLNVKGVEDLSGEPLYDVIWSISVIEHIGGDSGDDRDAVGRMWRALRPGGSLILTIPTDKKAWDEYREANAYGTQCFSHTMKQYFFQRFYDEQAIEDRIVKIIGCPPTHVEWFGEKKAGHFHAYIKRWQDQGPTASMFDPLLIARRYRMYSTFNEMPGVGVCGLVFVKPAA